MKTSLWPRLRLGLVAFVVSTVAVVAKPPPEWLVPLLAEDMTELSKGKVAVRLLESSEVRHTPDNKVKRVNHGAIRILTENGRTRARCAYQFNADTERVATARAWVITPDGKKAEEFGIQKFDDIAVRIGSIFWPQQRVLSHSAAADIPIGSVFAWEFEIDSQTGITDVSWGFPTDLSTLLAFIEVTPSPGGRLVWHGDSRIPAPLSGGQPGALRWERRRYPSVTSVGDRPAGFLAATHRLFVRNIPADNSALQTWTDVADLASNIMEPRLAPDATVRAKAESLAANRATRWDRVRAVSEFVQKEISYLAVILDPDYLAGYRPHAVSEVLANRHGDCKDKAALFVSMLRVLGDEAHIVLVTAGNPKAVLPDWPAAHFNHAIAAVRADESVPAGWPVVDAGSLGKVVLFDATDPSTPLGVLSPGAQGGFGLIASPKSSGLITLPISGAETNRVESKVQATLNERGDLSATVEEISGGNIGVTLHASRETLRNERFTPVMEARLRETMPNLVGLKWSDTWDAAAARWRLEFEFKAPRYARRTGGSLMMVSPRLLSSKVRLAPWKTTQEGVVWVGANLQHKQVRLELPAGAEVEELPDEWRQSTPIARAHLTCKRDGSTIVFDLEIRQTGGFLTQPQYEALRSFLQKIEEAERRPVLLRIATDDASAPKAASPK